jgi:hypothetical protein
LVLLQPAAAVDARVLFHGGATPAALRSFALACSAPLVRNSAEEPVPATEIVLPQHYSQYAFPDGGGWCSPVALTMLLAYWHQRTGNPALQPFSEANAIPSITVPAVFDPTYDGCGNWSFNTAYAAALGLEAYVTRLDSLAQVGRWVAAGVPLVLSIAWDTGELPGAPIPRSAGHLLLVNGFTASGDVIATDPAGSNPTEVRRIYPRQPFEQCWLRSCGGTAYIIHPPSWPGT